MTALDPLDRELLDFLCSCAHHRVRVVRVKSPRAAALRRLRDAGLVGLDSHLPSSSALFDWIERQKTKSEAVTHAHAAEEPPAPKAAAVGGGAARKITPSPQASEPPFDRDRLLQCFGDEFEQLIFVARRYGTSTAKVVTHARRLKVQGLVEYDMPRRGRAYCLWRRANSQPENITENIPRLPEAEGPVPSVEEPSAPVDLKVNAPARRDPTQPPPNYVSPEKRDFMRSLVSMKDRNRAAAERKLDAGETSAGQPNVAMRITMQRIEHERREQARLDCPIEQAKTVIRQAGWRCFAAVIDGGPPGQFYIGLRLVTEAELLAFAERLRTTRRRRAG